MVFVEKESFSGAAKAELCRDRIASRGTALAEAYGVLLFCNTFDRREIRIVTTSSAFAKRLPRLFRRAFALDFDVLPEQGRGKQQLLVTDGEKLRAIVEAFGGDDSQLSHHINFALLEDDPCRAAFLRGAFLAGGSLSDPRKRYQLELSTSHYRVAMALQPLMAELGLTARTVSRGANHVTYFKQSESISDFLTAVGAPLAAMEIMNTKMEKNIYNKVNRRSNCDMANLDKAVEAAGRLIDRIQVLQSSGTWDTLPDALRQTGQMRLQNPELSLSQLAQLCGVSKSCLNHRLRKLDQLAAQQEE